MTLNGLIKICGPSMPCESSLKATCKITQRRRVTKMAIWEKFNGCTVESDGLIKVCILSILLKTRLKGIC